MSEVLGKKLKQPKARGWEEAGGEFYQESYSTDWDGLPKNTFAITTLLPSKQNRFGTSRRIQNSPQDLKISKYWQTAASTTQRGYAHNEVQFSILPDLSQVLTDEERIWEEMLQIKLMPVSMQQKKEFKLNLQSATKLRLQGFNQFKWKNRKAWQQIGLKWTELITKLELWHSSLKQIEGHFGTGVVAYFLFLRWLFFLNCMTFLLILIFVIIPNVFIHKNYTENCNSSKCLPISSSDTDNAFNILDVVQGSGVLRNSIMFYGSYSSKISANYSGNYKNSSNFEPNFYYDLPLAYVFITVAYFLIALIAIVRASAREFKDRLINGKWQFYQYCNIVFGGWDFCIHNEKSGYIKHKAVYNEIKYLLHFKRIELERNNRSKNYMYKLSLTRIVINIIVLTILMLSAYLIYFLVDMSLRHKNISHPYVPVQHNTIWNVNHTKTYEEIRLKNDINSLEYNHIQESTQILDFFIDFVPYIAIVGLNLFLPTVFNYLCQFEKYSPLFVIKISLLRTIFLRLASLVILLSRFYYIVIPRSQNSNQSLYNCWETFVGQQFYKLVITDFVCHLLVTFCINFPRAFFARNINHNFVKFLGEQEFELPKHVLDIVYSQTICWIGSFYTPILPALVACITFCMFYIKKFQCLVNSKPSKILYGASRSNSLFMLILLLSYIVAVVPVTYAIAEIVPSLACGPFKGLNSVWDAPVLAFIKMPTPFKNFIFFFGTAGFAIPCFVLFTLLLYYFYAVSDANKKMVDVLKNQLILEGHDKQFLLTRLDIYLKQQQDVHGNNANSDQVN